jgi:nitrogen fixation NifU-like protein
MRDTMEIFLRFEGGRVREASFITDGCGPSMICGSLAAELATGKNPDEIREISAETILDTIGGLPEEDMHCASLAANTLQVALHNYDK